MPNYKLTYFDAKAFGEVPRLLFAKAGVEYEDVRVDQEIFKDLKDKTPLGLLPMLEVDGRTISQSFAIARFLGKRFGMYGENEFEEARIDEIAMGMIDTIQPIFKIMFNEPDEAKKAEQKKKYEEETIPNFLKFFERMLVQNNGGNGFFVGNSMTAADLFFVHYINFTAIASVNIDWNQFPKLKDLKQRVEEDEKIAAWIKKRPVTQF